MALVLQVMPYLKSGPRVQPLDQKAQKPSLRKTVFWPNGAQYTGEWQDNQKHGDLRELLTLTL